MDLVIGEKRVSIMRGRSVYRSTHRDTWDRWSEAERNRWVETGSAKSERRRLEDRRVYANKKGKG